MTQRVSSALAHKMFAVQTVLWSLQFSKSNSFELYKHYQTPLNFFKSGTVNLEMINGYRLIHLLLSLLYITPFKSKEKNVRRPNIKDI